MNRKQLILLILALVVLGGACLVLLNRKQESWNSSDNKTGRKLLDNIQLNDVGALHIKAASDLNLEKKNDRWTVRERGGYPANFVRISELLFKLGDLKIAQAEPIGPSQLARMHLTDPGSGSDSATLLDIGDGHGKILQSLLLGKKLADKPGPHSLIQFGDTDRAAGRYLMSKDDPNEILTITDPLTRVEPGTVGWLDKTFFKAEKPKSISFDSTNPADSWSLSRDSENAPWVMSNIKNGDVLDTNKLASLSSTLSSPGFVDVVINAAPAAIGLDKPKTVTVSTFDNFTYTIKIGSKTPENNYNVNVAVTADFPTERTPAKDEKPDDKSKLDKEFQDKLKDLQDKFEKEKRLEGWTFLVGSTIIDPITRSRADLMAGAKVEKKDDKKQATAQPEILPGKKSDDGSLLPPVDSDKE